MKDFLKTSEKKLSIIERILNWIEDKIYIRELKTNKIYATKDRDILVHMEEGVPILKVFIKGMLYHLPTNIDPIDASNIQEATDKVLALNMNILELPDLKSLLEKYEEEGNYEKCAELRDLIKDKENNGKTD